MNKLESAQRLAASVETVRGDCVAVLPLAFYLWRQPQLAVLLGMPLVANPFRLRRMRVVACAGWGLKPSGRYAAWRAAHLGLPCLRLEDGFLRSAGLGHEPPLSIVVDDLGIYYDAARPSRLEALIAGPVSGPDLARAKALMAAWRTARVSKYNHLPEPAADALPESYVLVADQTAGDASIRYGDAGAQSFRSMLQAALDENPEATVLVKVHPDVFAGRKRGYFDVAALSATPRVRVISEDVHPVTLIERAAAVYVVTSQLGFEGLLWGRRVRTFGMPFYAGWGLTADELPPPSRRRTVTLEQVVYAALVAYPRYLDPETGRRCEAERLIEWMGQHRRARAA